MTPEEGETGSGHNSVLLSLLQNGTLTEFLDTLDHSLIQPLLSFVQDKVFDNLSTNDFTLTLPDLVFDEFQWKLCKILGFIVATNLTLIYFFWRRVYGAKIVDKFMQPSSSTKLIEELKLSISELKLPKEHSPRL